MAEILEKVIYQQQNWVHNNSFVMRGCLLHFLFVIFTCNYMIFLLNYFYKYFSYAGYWMAV